MASLAISQRAIDLIVSCEVSSRSHYEKHYRSPEWPGGASGVTIAIGYDLGYATLAKERADWSEHCDEDELRVMDRCLGVRGEAARAMLPTVKGKIDIGWDAATAVFLGRDVPQWTAAVVKAIPGAERLSPDCLGALVSIAYNRGASFGAVGDRYAEMRAIKAHVVSGNLAAVPGDIRAMKRLWPTVKGLRDRRDAEAKLFEDGLKTPSIAAAKAEAAKPVIKETPPPALPPKPPGAAENGSAGATAAGTATVAAQSGWSPSTIAIVIALGIIAAVIVWLVVRKANAGPQVAREKDHPEMSNP